MRTAPLPTARPSTRARGRSSARSDHVVGLKERLKQVRIRHARRIQFRRIIEALTVSGSVELVDAFVATNW
jgi:hypothetical protein